MKTKISQAIYIFEFPSSTYWNGYTLGYLQALRFCSLRKDGRYTDEYSTIHSLINLVLETASIEGGKEYQYDKLSSPIAQDIE